MFYNNNKRMTRKMMERDRADDEMEIINPYSSYNGSYNPYSITDYYDQKVHTIVRDVISVFLLSLWQTVGNGCTKQNIYAQSGIKGLTY